MAQTTGYRIKELARLTGVRPRTIHYYVQLGLLPPPKGKARGAYYTDEHRRRLQYIRAFQDRGLSLGQIRDIFEGEEEARWQQRLEELSPEPVAQAAPPQTAETWERIKVAEGLEIHVSLPLTPELRQRVQALLYLLRARS